MFSAEQKLGTSPSIGLGEQACFSGFHVQAGKENDPPSLYEAVLLVPCCLIFVLSPDIYPEKTRGMWKSKPRLGRTRYFLKTSERGLHHPLGKSLHSPKSKPVFSG